MLYKYCQFFPTFYLIKNQYVVIAYSINSIIEYIYNYIFIIIIIDFFLSLFIECRYYFLKKIEI